jgi:hypothetical protein
MKLKTKLLEHRDANNNDGKSTALIFINITDALSNRKYESDF